MLLAGRMLSKFRHCVGISDAQSAAADQSTCARIGRNTAPPGMGAYNAIIPMNWACSCPRGVSFVIKSNNSDALYRVIGGPHHLACVDRPPDQSGLRHPDPRRRRGGSGRIS
jgi:hypothetical protein